MSPWLGMSLVSCAFVALMLLACWLHAHGKAGPEGTRKLLHIGMGIVTATFPWLFRESWPVLVLTGGFVVLLMAFRKLSWLREKVGHILCGVDRPSYGEIYFPVMVGFLFVVSEGRWSEYLIPLLVLTLADAAAALVGKRIGRIHYLGDEGSKSWEGSLVFIAVAWICVMVPLRLSGVDWVHAALTALCIATVTMLLEACAWRGLDNVFIPVAALLMTRFFSGMSPAFLWQNIGALAVLSFVHYGCRRASLLREGTLMGLLVLIYLQWALADWRWAVAPLAVLAVVPWVAKGKPNEIALPLHSHHALLSLGGATMLWLLVEKLHALPGFTGFAIVMAAHTSMICLSLWRTDIRKSHFLTLSAVTASWASMMMPWWFRGDITGRHLVLGFVGVLMTSLLFHFQQPRIYRSAFQHWTWRFFLAVSASIPALF